MSQDVYTPEEFNALLQLTRDETTKENINAKFLSISGVIQKIMRELNKRSSSERNDPTHKGILENRVVSDLKSFHGDNKGYRDWNEKMINALAQIRPKVRHFAKWVNELVNQ